MKPAAFPCSRHAATTRSTAARRTEVGGARGPEYSAIRLLAPPGVLHVEKDEVPPGLRADPGTPGRLELKTHPPTADPPRRERPLDLVISHDLTSRERFTAP